jgi:hypothetical protein
VKICSRLFFGKRINEIFSGIVKGTGRTHIDVEDVHLSRDSTDLGYGEGEGEDAHGVACGYPE